MQLLLQSVATQRTSSVVAPEALLETGLNDGQVEGAEFIGVWVGNAKDTWPQDSSLDSLVGGVAFELPVTDRPLASESADVQSGEDSFNEGDGDAALIDVATALPYGAVGPASSNTAAPSMVQPEASLTVEAPLVTASTGEPTENGNRQTVQELSLRVAVGSVAPEVPASPGSQTQSITQPSSMAESSLPLVGPTGQVRAADAGEAEASGVERKSSNNADSSNSGAKLVEATVNRASAPASDAPFAATRAVSVSPDTRAPIDDVKLRASLTETGAPLSAAQEKSQQAVAQTLQVAPSSPDQLAKAKPESDDRRGRTGESDRSVTQAQTGNAVQLPTDRPYYARVQPSVAITSTFAGGPSPVQETGSTGGQEYPGSVVGEFEEIAKTTVAERPRAEPAVARSIVTQMMHTVTRTQAEGVIEVRLQPEELGRVRLTMISGEAGFTVQVTAERPETLDLIRRNIDLLENDLKNHGFADMNFLFGGENQHDAPAFGDGDMPDGDAGETLNDMGLVIDVISPTPQTHNGTLDIRV